MSDNMGTLDFKLKDKVRDFKHKDNINGQMSDNMGTLDFKHKDNVGILNTKITLTVVVVVGFLLVSFIK